MVLNGLWMFWDVFGIVWKCLEFDGIWTLLIFGYFWFGYHAFNGTGMNYELGTEL